MTRITISPSILAAALLSASKEETRYYLVGVFIDARGWLVTTDGHRAFFAKCEDAKQLTGTVGGGIIIPSAAVAAVLKTKPKELALQLEAGAWSFVTPTATFGFEPVDGTFPDWTRIVPGNDLETVPGHYNPTYVADVGRVSSLLKTGRPTDKYSNSKFLIHQRGLNPAPITFSDDSGNARPDIGMVLMPIRHGDHTWANPLSAAA